MGKKGGQKQLNFIHMAAARTENIHILQAPLVSACFGGPLVSEDRAVLERCQTAQRKHTIAMHPPPKKKKKILPKKPFASTELNAAIETVTRKITPTVRCQQKQSQVYACQTSSSQISLLFVQPFYPSRPFSVPPHCPLFPV